MSEPNKTAEPSGASGGSLAWIPVTERLPVDIPHGYCLVTDGKEVGTANYDKTANKFDHCIDRDYWTPTHWMPLPAPPTDAK